MPGAVHIMLVVEYGIITLLYFIFFVAWLKINLKTNMENYGYIVYIYIYFVYLQSLYET